jgi:hypothetical protein
MPAGVPLPHDRHAPLLSVSLLFMLVDRLDLFSQRIDPFSLVPLEA